MKSLLLFVCLLLSGLANAQAVEVPKNALGIEIKSVSPDSATIDAIQTALENRGYIIDRVDPKRGTIVTQNKAFRGVTALKVLALVRNGVTRIEGQFSGQAMGYKIENDPVLYKGSNSGVYKSGFRVLEEIARELSQKLQSPAIGYYTK